MLIARRRARIVFSLFANLLTSLALLGPTPMGVHEVHEVRADAAFVVDSTADTFLMGSSDGICDDGSGHCTLREALIEAYYASGAKTITFSNSILPATINLVNGTLDLPGDDVLIDGPGASSLTIDVSALGPGSRGFAVTGNGNTIQHLRVEGAPEYGIIIYEATSGSANNNTIHDVVVTGSGYDGIVVHAYYGVGGAGNSVTDSLIGVGEWSDTACNETEGNNASGLWLSGKIRSTLVQGNRIVCNGDAGIYVVDTTVTDTDILDNRVGTDGDHAMGNGFAGLLSHGSDVEIEGNLVSGNAGIGIWVNTGDGVQVTGNKIGTNASGSAAIPNGGDGIYLGNLARNVVVGSASDPAARNLVSGNGGSGIAVSGTPTSGNPPQIDGNLIGLDAAGTAALPNVTAGLYIVYVDRPLTVGVDGAAVDQIISGNDGWGIRLYYSQNVTVGSSNYVGVAADHTTPLGNGGPGIGVAWANSSALTPAIVAHNGSGIIVEGDSSSGILIRPGDIHGNGGIAVDLGYDGPSANDPGDLDTGPNDRLNYPEITVAEGQLVSGSACLGCSVFIYEAVGDPTAIGGGGTYVMQVQADPGTGLWNATLPGALTARDVTLVASESPSPGNTSEMSPLYTANPSFIVDSTSDTLFAGPPDGDCDDGSGFCTLREALFESNAATGSKTITFSPAILPANIVLTGGELRLSADDITIDGPGTASLTISGGSLDPGISIFEINGSRNIVQHLVIGDSTGSGIRISLLGETGADDNLIHDVIVEGSTWDGIDIVGGSGAGITGNEVSDSLIGVGSWSDTACDEAERNAGNGIYVVNNADSTSLTNNRVVCSGNYGIVVDGADISGTSIAGNEVGTDGMHALGNAAMGVYDGQTTGTQISDNLLSANGVHGLWIYQTNGTVVKGNKIGTDQLGDGALPNGSGGVYAGWAGNLIIGSATESSDRNLISGNIGNGVSLVWDPASGAAPVINGNIIGLNDDGTTALANTGIGILISNVSLGATIGADDSSVDQLIAGNGASGIWVQVSQDVRIGASNYIGVAGDHSTAVGNIADGVVIGWSTNTTVTPAIVAHNGSGISVLGDSSSGILIRPGSVYGNGMVGVDLVGISGPDPNDPGDSDTGPNGILNYPEITSAEDEDISGTACLGCYVFIYDAIGDPAASGGGGTYLMQVIADPSTGVWNATLPGGLTAQDVTLMASESPSPGNTSEMSPLYSPPHFLLFLPLVLRNFP